MDKKITEILEKVEVHTCPQPSGFLQRLHQPEPELPPQVASAFSAMHEWSDLWSLGLSGTPDIAYSVVQNLYRKQADLESVTVTDDGKGTRAVVSKG